MFSFWNWSIQFTNWTNLFGIQCPIWLQNQFCINELIKCSTLYNATDMIFQLTNATCDLCINVILKGGKSHQLLKQKEDINKIFLVDSEQPKSAMVLPSKCNLGKYFLPFSIRLCYGFCLSVSFFLFVHIVCTDIIPSFHHCTDIKIVLQKRSRFLISFWKNWELILTYLNCKYVTLLLLYFTLLFWRKNSSKTYVQNIKTFKTFFGTPGTAYNLASC